MTEPVRRGGARKKKAAPEDEPLAALASLAPETERAAQNALIGQCLEHRHFRVVARAATLAGERGLREQVAQLVRAYPRFLDNPVKKDPQCIAKQAITGALVALDATDVELFRAGIRYRQMEPTWGPPTDTAINVRVNCAMGLVATGYPRAIPELTTLLTDPEWRVRSGAARAISCGNPGEAEAVLRLKVLNGDSEPEVIGECFTGLVAVAPADCVPFVAGYLSSAREGVSDFAALALGESRRPEALEHLRAAWQANPRSAGFRGVLIRAAGLHRSAAAFDWLIELIERGAQADADAATESLSIYERNTKLGERVQAALAKRREAGDVPE